MAKLRRQCFKIQEVPFHNNVWDVQNKKMELHQRNKEMFNNDQIIAEVVSWFDSEAADFYGNGIKVCS